MRLVLSISWGANGLPGGVVWCWLHHNAGAGAAGVVNRPCSCIDGADEADGELRLIKGGGGALLREKIVASLSKRVVIVADAGKKVAKLGAFPLPVEVVPFAASALLPKLAAFGCEARLRGTSDAGPFVSDEGNHIIDCSFGAIADPEGLAQQLNAMPGVVEHGLFLGIAERVLLGGTDGVEELVRAGV